MKTYKVFSKPHSCHNFHPAGSVQANNYPAALLELERRHGRMTGAKRIKWRGLTMRFECFDPSGQFNIVRDA